jgi:hypothetical protein
MDHPRVPVRHERCSGVGMRRGVRTRVVNGIRSGIRIVVAAMMFSMIAPQPADAGFWCWLFDNCDTGSATHESGAPQQAAPEIDPGALASAIALATGGAAMLSGRVRRRR